MTNAMKARLWRGPAAYDTQTNWGPVGAIIAVIAMFILAAGLGLLFAQAVAVVSGQIPLSNIGQIPKSADEALAFTLVWQIGLQIGLVVLVLVAVRLFGDAPQRALALKSVPGGIPGVLAAFGLLMAVAVAYSAVVYVISPRSILADLQPFVNMARSDMIVLLGLVAVIGAPLSEEFVFRGFLLSALAKTRLRYAGAALVTTAAWSALHFNYSINGLAAVFLIGLTLSWILWRTGSLWVTILCHGLYNGLVLGIVVLLAHLPAAQ